MEALLNRFLFVVVGFSIIIAVCLILLIIKFIKKKRRKEFTPDNSHTKAQIVALALKKAKTRAEKAALMAIQALEEKIVVIPADYPGQQISENGYYRQAIVEIEKKIEIKLDVINKLVMEHGLENEVYEECRKKAIEVIYNAAISRKEYEWAAAFAKKHSL